MRNSRAAEDADYGQHGGNPRTIVGNSRTIQAAALLPNVQWRGRRKHRVNMSAQRHEAAAVAGTNAEHVAHFIDVHIDKPEFAKAVGQPGAAGRLPERRRSNPSRLHLPQRELRFLGAKPVERSAHLRRAGEPRHFLLHWRIRIGSCHLWNRLQSLRLSYNEDA